MDVTLVLTSRIADELFGALSMAIESACVLLARQVETPGRQYPSPCQVGALGSG